MKLNHLKTMCQKSLNENLTEIKILKEDYELKNNNLMKI